MNEPNQPSDENTSPEPAKIKPAFPPVRIPTPVGEITPMGLPVEGEECPSSVVLFGGTFDPPHIGHVELPLKVRDEIERRERQAGGRAKVWLVYVPAARSPHKSKGPSVSNQQRLDMLKLSLNGVPRTCVWTDELVRASVVDQPSADPLAPSQEHQAIDKPSYTVDTMGRARDWLDAMGLASTTIRLLIGADQAVSFHTWHLPRQIFRLAAPAVMVRGETANADALLTKLDEIDFWSPKEMRAWREGVIPVGIIDVSATQLRTALRRGDEGEANRWLRPGVAKFIRDRGLYGS